MTAATSTAKRFSPSNCELPLEGVQAIKVDIVYDDDADVEVSLFDLLQDGTVSSFQTLYYFNKDPNWVKVVCKDTDQQFTIPGSAYGYFPILVTKEGKFVFTVTGGGKIELHFINVPIYPINIEIISNIF
jgi:hypothetical protein